MQVTVCGLVKRPELNGMDAKVLRFDEQRVRYEVALADGTEIALKPECLSQPVKTGGTAATASFEHNKKAFQLRSVR